MYEKSLKNFAKPISKLTPKLIPPVPRVVHNLFSGIYGNSTPNLTIVSLEHKSVHDSGQIDVIWTI